MPWQPVPVVFPDVELLVTTNLRTLLHGRGATDVAVGRSIPNPRAPRMVGVTRDGGGGDGLTDRPRIRIRVWDLTPEAANNLSALVAALMPLLVGTTAVTRVQKLSGPLEVPDSSGGNQRYLLFELHTEGAPLS